MAKEPTRLEETRVEYKFDDLGNRIPVSTVYEKPAPPGKSWVLKDTIDLVIKIIGLASLGSLVFAYLNYQNDIRNRQAEQGRQQQENQRLIKRQALEDSLRQQEFFLSERKYRDENQAFERAFKQKQLDQQREFNQQMLQLEVQRTSNLQRDAVSYELKLYDELSTALYAVLEKQIGSPRYVEAKETISRIQPKLMLLRRDRIWKDVKDFQQVCNFYELVDSLSQGREAMVQYFERGVESLFKQEVLELDNFGECIPVVTVNTQYYARNTSLGQMLERLRNKFILIYFESSLPQSKEPMEAFVRLLDSVAIFDSKYLAVTQNNFFYGPSIGMPIMQAMKIQRERARVQNNKGKRYILESRIIDSMEYESYYQAFRVPMLTQMLYFDDKLQSIAETRKPILVGLNKKLLDEMQAIDLPFDKGNR
ncbi:MAG TPA: hypothetical protein VI233_12205 [Puia sp.]